MHFIFSLTYSFLAQKLLSFETWSTGVIIWKKGIYNLNIERMFLSSLLKIPKPYKILSHNHSKWLKKIICHVYKYLGTIYISDIFRLNYFVQGMIKNLDNGQCNYNQHGCQRGSIFDLCITLGVSRKHSALTGKHNKTTQDCATLITDECGRIKGA